MAEPLNYPARLPGRFVKSCADMVISRVYTRKCLSSAS